MKAKKIILFIVEGITDKTCLGYILDQLLSDQLVRFELTDGDITTKIGNSSSNIAAKIGNIVKDFSGSIFKPNDFLEVVHLVDIDGSYISDDKVIQADYSKPFYTDENILTNNVNGIKKITLNKVYRTIPYSVYFFSCNLDHVLHNERNLLWQDKIKYANLFEKEYADQSIRFVEFLHNHKHAVDGSYVQSWDFIKLNAHSLQRYTNFHLYFSNPKNSLESMNNLQLSTEG